MSPTLNGSSALQCFKHSNKICNGKNFNFNPGLPQLRIWRDTQLFLFEILHLNFHICVHLTLHENYQYQLFSLEVCNHKPTIMRCFCTRPATWLLFYTAGATGQLGLLHKTLLVRSDRPQYLYTITARVSFTFLYTPFGASDFHGITLEVKRISVTNFSSRSTSPFSLT